MKKLGFGCMRLPLDGDGSIDMDALNKMVDAFMEKGFTYFDTSYVYHNGNSEKVLKEALVKRYPRDSFTITTKSPVFMIRSQKQFFDIFREQLDRLGTDHVDYYWLHAINRNEYAAVQKYDLVGALKKLKEDGGTKHIGMSYHDSPELLDQILTEQPELEFVQLQLNYFDWDSPFVASRDNYEVCRKHGKPVIVMEPLKGGNLVSLPPNLAAKMKAEDPEVSIASWGIRFAASLENVYMVLSGMSDEEQMNDNLSYMEHFVPMNDREQAIIREAQKELRATMPYQPESFRKAEEICPKRIGIMRIVQMLNERKAVINDGKVINTPIYYDIFLDGYGKAAECDRCGKCDGLVDGIDIPALLEEADDELRNW
ncbi:MAG: aldo/keto reductase [Anaerovoracaceae bacterium]|jgi:predicted aldo/keto reductase-like oxidoreductase